MKTLVRALLVEDDEDDVVIAREFLSHIETFDFAVDWVSSISKARSRVLEDDYDIFLIDYHLGGENGLDFVHFVHDLSINTHGIISSERLRQDLRRLFFALFPDPPHPRRFDRWVA